MNSEKLIINTAGRVAKNAGALVIGTIVNKICSLAFFILIGRHFGEIGLGNYTFALSFVAIFIVLGDMGLNMLAIREVAKDKSSAAKYLGNIAVLKMILSAIAVGIIFLAINLLNYPPEATTIVYIVGASMFFDSLSRALRWVFQAYQRMEYEALVNIVQGLFLLGIGSGMLYLGRGLINLAVAHLFANAAIFCLSFVITVRNFVKPKFEIDFGFWKHLIKFAIPIGLMNIFVIVYFSTNTVMLSLLKGSASVGLYNAGYKLIEAIKFIPTMFVLAIFPVMAVFYKSSIESLQKVLRKSVQYMFLLALPIAGGVTMLSYKIIPAIWGERFAQSIIVLQILVWVSALSFVSSIAHHYLVARDKQKIALYTIGTGLILNVILNLLLIPIRNHL